MCNKIRINGNKKINHNTIRAKVGITDKTNQSVFYLEGCSFMTPQENNENFTEVLNEVESLCKKSLKHKLFSHPDLAPDFITNFNSYSSRMTKGKKTFISFQYHFKQRNNNNESLVLLKERNEDFFIGLLNDIENNLALYNITLSKKKSN